MMNLETLALENGWELCGTDETYKLFKKISEGTDRLKIYRRGNAIILKYSTGGKLHSKLSYCDINKMAEHIKR